MIYIHRYNLFMYFFNPVFVNNIRDESFQIFNFYQMFLKLLTYF